MIGECPEFDVDDTRAAITAAARSFESFRRTIGRERSKLLRQWHDAVIGNAEDLATFITWENGKTITEARSEEAPRAYGDTIPSSNPDNRILTYHEPISIYDLITP